MFRNRAAQDLGAPSNNTACRLAAQRNQELFRMMFELISLREKMAQVKVTPSHPTHIRSLPLAANTGANGDRQRSRRFRTIEEPR
jgi:hypothetical protein